MNRYRYYILLIIFMYCCHVFAQDSEWHIMGEMAIPVADGKAVTFHDKIYIIGGYAENQDFPVDLIQEFDPYEGTWNTIGHLVSGRRGLIADVFSNSLVICGYSGDTGSNDVCKFLICKLICVSGVGNVYLDIFGEQEL